MSRGFGTMQRDILRAYNAANPGPPASVVASGERYPRSAITGYNRLRGLCRKFLLEVICSMISPYDPQ